MELPKFLYHYTSIDTLACILNSKKLKLTSLCYVDDEKEINNIVAKYCYVSCWTAEERESIPMWEMYSNGMKGVRIKLPVNPFIEYPLDKKRFGTSKGFIPAERILGENTTVMGIGTDCLKAIEYLNEVDLLRNENELNTSIAAGEFNVKNDLGIYKDSAWEFQKEWRYKYFILPGNYSIVNDPLFPSNMISGKYPAIEDGFFIELDENKMQSMEILLGPYTTYGDKLLVELLRKEYVPSAIVKNSALKIRKK